METDKIARYLSSLEREDCFRVDATLKESPHELTQRVFFVGSNGAEQGPYVRKFIHRESGMGSAYERIFEAQQHGQRFKHIPQLLDCYRHDSFLVVVMEFVNGETLQDLVYRRDPSTGLAADVFPRLCDAVTELHESFDPPIIHRDLKPSNVMLTDSGLTIIDFGIAREFKQGADNDTTKFGTRAFAPPEQFGFGQTTVRSDVYALGMLLYFCLTEKIPTAQVRDAHFEAENVPPELRSVIVRATALDPEGRYASAAALKDAFVEATTRIARPDSEGKTPKRRRTAVIAAACIALVLGVVLCGLLATGATGAFSQSANQESQNETAQQTSESSSAGTSEEAQSAIDDAVAVNDEQTNAPQRNGFDPATNITATVSEVSFQIPEYFGARVNQNDDGVTYYYAESGSSISMLMTSESSLGSTDMTDIDAVKDEILVGLLESDKELFAEIISSTDFSLAGHSARIVTIKGTISELTETTTAVYFINEATNTVGMVLLGQSDNTQFNYSADFAKVIESATPAE